MTLKRRLDAVETSLSPTQLVLRWLAEAHAYGDIESYVASLLAADPPVAPLDRLAREAAHGGRTFMRGKRPELVNAAVRSALRETVFRFELAMRINVTTKELLDREELISALFASQLAMLLAEEGGRRPPDDSHLNRLELCRRLTAVRVNELLALQEARVSVEAAPPEEHDAVTLRAGELVADLVEPAKSTALEKLGEGQPAFDIANAWLRAKLMPKADVTTDVAPPDGP